MFPADSNLFFPQANVTFGDCWVRKAGGPNLNCHFFFPRVFEDDGNFWLFSFFFFFFFPHFLLLLLLLVSTITSSLSWSLLRLLLDWPALVIYPGVMFGQCKLHNSGSTRETPGLMVILHPAVTTWGFSEEISFGPV